MFDRIAPRYDLANHLLSGGADYFWRRRAARIVEQWQPAHVLDVACGSGDLAIALQRRIPAAQITAIDFADEMIALARRKGVQNALVADAMNLPFPSGSFHAVTIAFGLRNMADWAAALREMRRVLATAGHLLVLDFSSPVRVLRPVYRTYLHHVLPRLAAAITGAADAYGYLGDSIERFPSGAAMLELISQNGFRAATATPLSAGIATIYTAAAAP
jgi:demethylmenaquinone methyltransferase/2-methoxy-6-polyprenyl-1,4-benzoquinol methylase